jgi:hypothetical protein
VAVEIGRPAFLRLGHIAERCRGQRGEMDVRS